MTGSELLCNQNYLAIHTARRWKVGRHITNKARQIVDIVLFGLTKFDQEMRGENEGDHLLKTIAILVHIRCE